MAHLQPTRVLLVEDNPTDAFMVRQFLEDEEPPAFAVSHVRQLADAPEHLATHGADVLLLDLFGKDFRGVDGLKTLNGSLLKLPIVILTGTDSEALAHQATQSGAQDYLVKGRDSAPNFKRALRQAVERKRMEEHVSFITQHDALTGLPNRGLLKSHLLQALARARRHDQSVALMFLDVDRFKLINDSYGMSAGDELLRAIAGRLRECLRSSDLVARIDGDEFAMLVEEMEGPADAERVAAKVLETLSRPFDLNGAEVFATTSIGIALFPSPHTMTAEALTTAADVAKFRAKELGRNNYQFFSPDMLEGSSDLLRLDAELRHAVELGQLVLFYQPQIELTTGRVIGVEALLRWNHPRHGMVPPGDFIPLAEENGVIVQIGEWVLREACRQLATWNALGFRDLTVAVNISAVQFRQGNLARLIGELLEKHDLRPQSLEVELTEGTLIEDSGTSNRLLAELQALDVRISIDDFGTGYSSLSYLKRLPLDCLKIDRSFVDGLGQEQNDEAIAECVISMARALGLKVIAEGIETPTQYRFLREKGCDIGQGFLFSKAVPAAEIQKLFGTTFPSPR